MKSLALVPFASLLLATSALAQDDVLTLNVPIEHVGTLHMATGVITPPIQMGPGMAALATPGVIYNNNALPYAVAPCNTVFINGIALGQARIDDGRIPTRTSPAPATGALDEYFVSSFQIGYCTTEDDPSIGGPGARVTVLFWENYDGCIDLTTAGAPTAAYNLTLPGTLTTGTNRCVTININLVGGFEFTMKGDAEGTFNGTAADDKFGWGMQVNTLTTGKTISIIRAGQLTGSGATVAGDGTHYQNPGTVQGTGLDNDNLYYLSTSATAGNCFAGATTQTTCPSQPGPIYGGYYLQMTAADLTDCNGNGRSDDRDLALGSSVDLNANGVPDECDPPPAPVNYCTAGTTTNGCVAAIAASANPSVSFANACNIAVSNIEGQKSGLIFYSITGQASAPWNTSSFLCVKSPTQRTGTQTTGGTVSACDGAMSLDWNAYQTSNPGALGNPWLSGTKVQVQAWFRDPPAGKSTNLSDAVEMTYVP
ncbi:MAG: hypothetical protein HUU28_03750 [Planctomycetaceae bacterium]|nr:hypothetical protein [Planctomycetaceae bacterium]